MTFSSTTLSNAETANLAQAPHARMTAPKPVPSEPAPRKKPSKSTQVVKLLSRGRGATSNEIAESTGWQPHRIRAFLSILRKKGTTLARESRKSGELAYRIAIVDVAVPDASGNTKDAIPTGAPAELGVADATALIEGA